MKLSKCCHQPVYRYFPDKDIYYCRGCNIKCDTIEQDEPIDFVPSNTAKLMGLSAKDYELNDYKRGFKAGQESNEDILEENRMIAGETLTPNDWIEEKMKELDKEIFDKCWDLPDLICHSQRLTIKQQEIIKKFLKSSLLQQKEAIEKGWEKKLDKTIHEIAEKEVDCELKGYKLGKEEKDKEWESKVEKIKFIIKNIKGYSPDGEIGTLCEQALKELLK